MKMKLCRKCGKPFTGYGSRCDCILDVMSQDRKGQRDMFGAASQDSEVLDYMAYVNKIFNLPPDDLPVPRAILRGWISNKCITRKLHDDWTSLYALQGDFHAYCGQKYAFNAFKDAIEKAGYAIEKDMVSRLVIKEDLHAVSVHPLRPRAQIHAASAVAQRHRAAG
jgi:hypothetical protein